MKSRTKLLMFVQHQGEPAAEFASRLEKECARIQEEAKIQMPPICIPTSAGDGRQTVTIQWHEEAPDPNGAVFDWNKLRRAYDKYKEDVFIDKQSVDGFYEWLGELKDKDLI